MKKKSKIGMTVVELVVVIALIALMLSIVIPVISGTIKNQKEKLYNVQIDNIKKGATAWGSANLYLMPHDDGDSISVTLGELKSKGFVKKDITNPKTEQIFGDNVLVVVTKKNNTYLYNVENISNNDQVFDKDAPYIILNGGPTEYVEINGGYNEKGVQARDKDGNQITSITTFIKKNGKTVSDVTTDQLSTYVITYVATDISNGKSSSVSRNVIVHDTIAPIVMVNGININYKMIVKKGSTFNIPTAVVVDNSGETLTPTIDGTVNTSVEGNYELIYEAKDSSKNTGRLIIMAVVKDIGKEIFINYKVSTSLWTNQDVTMTILPVHNNPLPTDPYSFDGGTGWQASPDKVFSTNQNVKMQARDNEGQESDIVSYTIANIDKTLPTCNITGNPTNWVTSATLTVTGTDGESGLNGIKLPGSSEYLSLSSTTFNVTDNGIYTASVKDTAGNINTCSVTVTKVDSQSPTCTITGNPTNWVKGATLTITGSDSESGIVAIKKPGDIDYTAATSSATFNVTSNATYTAYVKDGVNHIGTCNVIVTKVDNVAPTTPVITNSSNGNWTNGSITLSWIATDNLSGIDIYQYAYSDDATTWTTFILSEQTGIVRSDERNNVLYIRAVDKAGNVSTPSSTPMKIDKTAPTCVSSGGSSTWRNTNLTLTGTCSDSASGCAIATITKAYSTNTNSTTESPGTVTDIAGNSTVCPANQTVKIDKTAPTCTSSGGSTTWRNINLTLTGTCSDTGGSGCVGNASKVYSVNTNSTVESPGNVNDNAGNSVACPTNQTVKIDKNAPTVTYNPNGNPTQTQSQSSIVTVSDSGGSNISSLQYEWSLSNTVQPAFSTTFTSGQTLTKNINSTVTYYLWIKAVDTAGNTTVNTSNAFNFIQIHYIYYDGGTGTGAPATTSYTGSGTYLSSAAPTKSGYIFTGWSTTAGGAVIYHPGDYYTGSDTTLYAVYCVQIYVWSNTTDSWWWCQGIATHTYYRNLSFNSTTGIFTLSSRIDNVSGSSAESNGYYRCFNHLAAEVPYYCEGQSGGDSSCPCPGVVVDWHTSAYTDTNCSIKGSNGAYYGIQYWHAEVSASTQCTH